MLTSHELGILRDRIHVKQRNSESLRDGGGAHSQYSERQAILVTAASVIKKEKPAGANRGVGIRELAAAQRKRVAASQPVIPLDAMEAAKIGSHTYPNGCHVAEVEVGPETGVVAVPRYIMVDDVGHALTQPIVRGHVHGGVAQGVCQALFERTAHDTGSGQPLSTSCMEYVLARRGPTGHRRGPDRGGLPDQPARREGRGRGRHHWLLAGW
jgi:carbon-monoxide dehydrogenase large subunit